MSYLLLSIICSVLVAIIFKINGNKESNIYAIVTVNYVAAITISLIISISDGVHSLIDINNFLSFTNEMENVFSNANVFSLEASAIWAIIVGIIFGPIFCFAFFRYRKGIVESGMGITNTFMKLSVIIPILISMMVWKEYPSGIQSIGIILCIISILILNLDFNNTNKINFNKNLLILTIVGGLAQFTAKIYQKYGLVDCTSILTLFTFISAFITSLIFLFRNREPIVKRDIITGLIIGIPNLLATSFLVLALEYIDTHITYLISSLLSIIIVLIIGLIFLKEQLRKKDLLAVSVSIIAIFLLNS